MDYIGELIWLLKISAGIFVFLWLVLGLAAVWAVGRAFEEVLICDKIRASEIHVPEDLFQSNIPERADSLKIDFDLKETNVKFPKDWAPFLRPQGCQIPCLYQQIPCDSSSSVSTHLNSQCSHRFCEHILCTARVYIRAGILGPIGFMWIIGTFIFMGLWGSVFSGSSPLWLYPIIARPLSWCLGMDLEISGQIADVPLMVLNHSGILDMHWITSAYHNITALAKKETEGIPFIGKVAKQMKCIFVDRGDKTDRTNASESVRKFLLDQSLLREKSVKDAGMAKVEVGQQAEDHENTDEEERLTLVAYPEGTTTNHLHILPFKSGVFTPFTEKIPCSMSFQAVTIKYPNPHFSFSISTNQLVPFMFSFGLGGGTVRLHFGTVFTTSHDSSREEKEFLERKIVKIKPSWTAEYLAEKVREEIAGNFLQITDGSYRAHVACTNFISSVENSTEISSDKKIQ